METIAYLINRETKSLYLPVKKVAHSALVTALNPVTERVGGKKRVKEFLGYTWIMVVRDPLDRFNSFYRADRPGKRRVDPDGLLDDVLEGYWSKDSHTEPQANYLDDLKIPEIIVKYENLQEEFWRFKGMFPGCLDLQPENISPRERDLWRDFTPEQIEQLRERYARDYELFGY